MGVQRHLVTVILAASALAQGCKSAGQGATDVTPAPVPAPAPSARVEPDRQPIDSAAPTTSVAPPPVSTATDDDQVVARVGQQTITMAELREPLVRAYGLNVLLNLVQLELAERTAAERGLVITDADMDAELQRTLKRSFPDADPEDYDALLEQLLTQQRISREELRIVLRTNATLRALAEPMVEGKITEEGLEEAFRALYGEKIRVRHVQAANMQEIQEAKRRIDAGEPFADVARELSRNARTRSLGGELPAFTRATPGLPQAFKDAAFSLNVGEVSDPVLADDAYHLIKVEEQIDPKAVKFEDVKESIREDLTERAIEAVMRQLRTQFGQEALESLEIVHPELKQQFDDRRAQRQAEVRGRQAIIEQMERERQIQAEQATTAPAATETTAAPATTDAPATPATPSTPEAPATPETPVTPQSPPTPATPETSPAEGLRPPATLSGEPANRAESPDGQ